MKIQQKKFTRAKGWQTLKDEHADENLCNLVLVFGSTEILSDHLTYSSIRDNYPNADILLNTTAVEIIDTEVNDETISLTAISSAPMEKFPLPLIL